MKTKHIASRAKTKRRYLLAYREKLELESDDEIVLIDDHLNELKQMINTADRRYLKRKKLKVFLDDERETPKGWVRVYWPDEAIKLLKHGNVVEISLDHDLGDDARGTGYDVILWLENRVINHKFKPPVISVHSANISARQKMEQGIKSIIHHSKK